MLTIGQCATLACLLEVTAPKPGNVHRGADFEDLTFVDFVSSAVVVGPLMEQASTCSVGQTVLRAVQETQCVARTNTNLGIILLLAPLASVDRSKTIAQGIAEVLECLDAQDARLVYEAIRMAAPGGLDPLDEPVTQYRVEDNAPPDLPAAMRHAASRDLVARQYINEFDDVLETICPWLLDDAANVRLSRRIVHAHVRMMSHQPDSLIRRKCGDRVASEAAARAAAVVQAGPPNSESFDRSLAELDFWLRSDGSRRNPGTTADLITAGLFVLLREGKLQPPFD